ncbi:MAG: GNAT family N-acetyltransferase [Actinomycetota bacterium]|nr:GNAT family N-acetyltransferase [Actinomycetota bacterium]
MFVTRATRHDKEDIGELLATNGWGDADLSRGSFFIARDGAVVGCVQLIEVAPQTLVFDNVLVREDRRGESIGRRVIQAALNNKGGTVYLCCHEERLAFYGHFGFAEVGFDNAPEPVQSFWREVGDHPTEPGHVHYFLKAR